MLFDLLVLLCLLLLLLFLLVDNVYIVYIYGGGVMISFNAFPDSVCLKTQ